MSIEERRNWIRKKRNAFHSTWDRVTSFDSRFRAPTGRRLLATNAGFPEDRVAFVTAFEDRSRPAFRRLSSELAWGTVAWFESEPERLILFMEETVTLDRLPHSPR